MNVTVVIKRGYSLKGRSSLIESCALFHAVIHGAENISFQIQLPYLFPLATNSASSF